MMEQNASPNPVDDRDSHIAIIGIAGRFPGADNPQQFWENIRRGVESISFFSDEEVLAEGVPEEILRRPDCVKAHGVLDGTDLFDAGFFGYSGGEAELIDPQQRLFLEAAIEALQDAGYTPESCPGPIGLFAGASFNTYYPRFRHNPELRRKVGGLLQHLSNNRDFLTTRVAYKLNLRGPSVTLQTACSTSLVAVHSAVQSLLNGECEMALAGGVSVTVPQKSASIYQPGGIVSADGHCRAYDAEATGTPSGCGLGIVVLKSFVDARADGDQIYAVIRGSAINNDGSGKVGFTAPSIEGQAAVIQEALAVAGVEPQTIGYVEGHGTGTTLGDPIEVEALQQAFAAANGDDEPLTAESCALGSVKTNIGHLDTASGVAGLIKTVMALRHGELPPSLHFERPNPEIDFTRGPFYVNARLDRWPSEGTPRRAGVSSFGLGGTNAHVVLEEAPPPEPSGPGRHHHLLLLSGHTLEVLQRSAENLADHLARCPEVPLADVAYTLQVGRQSSRHRLMVLCRDHQEAEIGLRSWDKSAVSDVREGRKPSLVFLFPNGEALGIGTGRELLRREVVFQQELERVAQLFEHRRLTEPLLSRAAAFAVEHALAKLLLSWGVSPSATLGADVGEYVAAVVSGALSLEDGVALLSKADEDQQSALLRSSSPEDLAARSPLLLLEMGPGTEWGRRLGSSINASEDALLSTLGGLEDEDDTKALLNVVGRLWLAGVEIDWDGFYTGQDRRRVSLPPTPFERQSYWVDAWPAAPADVAAPNVSSTGEPRTLERPLAFLFPGLGDHYPNMARELYETQPVFRSEIERCAELLQPSLGEDLQGLLYSAAQEEESLEDASTGPDLRRLLGRGQSNGNQAPWLKTTRLAQPVIFAVEYALARLWQSWGAKPQALLGYSLGEYTAACLAGVLSLEDALALVSERARLIGELAPGAMLAVPLPENKVVPRLGDELSLAATYTPDVCIVAGPEVAIAGLEQDLATGEVVSRRIQSGHALHSTMMEPIAGQFAELVKRFSLKPPEIPYLSNVTGTWIGDDEATDPAYWVRHLCQTVRFSEGLEKLLGNSSGPRGEAAPDWALLEVGPGQALSMAARQHPAKPETQPVVASLREGHDRQSDVAFILSSLERLRQAGVAVDSVAPGAQEHRQVSALVSPAQPTADSAAPSRIEAEIGEILRGATGVELDQEHMEMSFPELGIHSLMLMQVSHSVQDRFEVEVPFRDMIEELRTPASLVAHLRHELPPEWSESPEPATPAVLDEPQVDVSPEVAGSAFQQILERIEGLSLEVAELRSSVHGDSRPRRPAAAPAARTASAARTTPAAQAAASDKRRAGPWRPVQKGGDSQLRSRQKQYLGELIERYNQRTATSKRLSQQHRSVLADVRVPLGFRQLWKELVYPITAERSAGSRMWDVDGNEYVDLLMGFGVNFFGHSPDFIREAMDEQLASGMHLGPQSDLVGEVAERVSQLTGCERVCFCNTGSEAVLIAMRLARTVTGRDKIAFFRGSYHGLTDPVLADVRGVEGNRRVTPFAPGIPQSMVADTLILDYNQPEALAEIERHAHEIGAILVEPIQASRPSLAPREFLHELRALTERLGIALVFDEMITGFRLHPGGAQAFFGVEADLATYGKVVGGGLPIGLVAGRSAFMDAVDGGSWQFGDDSYPRATQTYIAGTFSKHPLVLAASRAVLERLQTSGPELQQSLNEKTAALAAELDDVFGNAQLPICVDHGASLFQFAFDGSLEFADLLQYHMIERGVHLWGGRRCFLSTAHTDDDLRRIVDAVKAGIADMQDGDLLPRPTAVAGPAIESVGEGTVLPLTENQQALWFEIHRGGKASQAYHEVTALRWDGEADPAVWRGALRQVIGRHEALRCVFDERGETQRILDQVPIALPFVDLTALPATRRENELECLLRHLGQRSFDVTTGPLWRCVLARLAEDAHVLGLVFHHLIIDGWSLSIIGQELYSCYAAQRSGQPIELPPVARFQDYVRSQTEPQRLEEDEAYWLTRFQTLPAVFEPPTDRPRPPISSFSGSQVHRMLDTSLVAGLEQLSSQNNGTLVMTLLAGYQTFLHGLTGQDDLVVGVGAAGQSAVPGQRLVGYCLHVLPLRSSRARRWRFDEHLVDTRQHLLDAYDHRAYSLARLVRQLGIERDPSRPALIGAIFNLDHALAPSGSEEAPVSEVEISTESSKFDFSLNLLAVGTALKATLEYRADLFDRSTIHRWLAAYETLLQAVVREPGIPVSALSSLSPGQQHQLLVEWNDTSTDPPREHCLHEIFEAWAAETPEVAAVLYSSAEEGAPQQRLTYAELDAKANQLARRLHELGVGPEAVVGVCLERSPEMVVSVLGVLKAGAAYMALDPAYPGERLGFMLGDAKAPVLLTQERLRSAVPAPSAEVICLDSDVALAGESTERPPSRARIGNLAYVIYTSGSTGRPKGVAVEHRGLVNLVTWHHGYFQLEAGDRTAQVAGAGFDASVYEIWSCLTAGASLCIVPDEVRASPPRLLDRLLSDRVDSGIFPTPLAEAVLTETWPAELTLKSLLAGGDRLHRNALEDLPIPLYNGYGPTENTVVVTCHKVMDDGSDPPIGRPIANVRAYVLDRELRPVPIGVAGELCAAGGSLARGYLGRPALTAERFVCDPYSTTPGERLYRTGDRVRLGPGGEFEFLERLDHQVKVRGFRIELGEIEAVLSQHPTVRKAVVIPREEGARGNRLIAYVAAVEAPDDLKESLRERLQASLPAYMVPSSFVLLDALPLTPNGKVDRQALATMSDDTRHLTDEELVLPRTSVEAEIRRIWIDLLEIDGFGVHDNFFELGGHSLLVVKLLTRLQETFGLRLSVKTLFEASTIAELATVLESPESQLALLASTNGIDLMAEVQLDDTIRPSTPAAVSPTDPTAIFLTGATGFLGAFLLDALLAKTEGRVYCLVRAGDADEGFARIRANLEEYLIWSPEAESRIVPVVGDLGRPLLGLSQERFEELAASLGAIYHCGAWVNFTYPYEALKAANVLGTQEALRLASTARSKPFHFISTLAVCSEMELPDGQIVTEDTQLDDTDGLSNGYVQSKWVAEKIVHLARSRGMPVSIHRPGIVGGHSETGASNDKDLVWRWFKGIIQLQATIETTYPFDVVPVDYFSQAVVYLSQQESSTGKVFHFLNSEPMTINQVCDFIESAGYPLRRTPYSEWRDLLLRALREDSGNALMPFLPMFNQTTAKDHEVQLELDDGGESTAPKFDDRNTRQGLSESGISCPPVNVKLLRNYVDYFIESGFLAPPEGGTKL